jgi:hypothetical protein
MGPAAFRQFPFIFFTWFPAAPGCSRYTALLRRAGVASYHPWPGALQNENEKEEENESAAADAEWVVYASPVVCVLSPVVCVPTNHNKYATYRPFPHDLCPHNSKPVSPMVCVPTNHLPLVECALTNHLKASILLPTTLTQPKALI